MDTDIRPSPLAGRWYPAHPKKLAESVDGFIQEAQVPEIQGEILALITPHAGHIYSGPVAGYAFKCITGMKPELVVILSPYHQHHPGAILTSGHQAYQTPLGEVPIEGLLINAVLEQGIADVADFCTKFVQFASHFP